MESNGQVQFHFLTPATFLKKRRELKKFILQLIKAEGKRVEHINYIFCSDDYLLKINRKYLKHNYYTDIITFDLSEENQKVIADIFISIDRVVENARTIRVSRNTELCRIIFHGALHMCGYKDKEKHEKAKMNQKEDEYLLRWFHVELSRRKH